MTTIKFGNKEISVDDRDAVKHEVFNEVLLFFLNQNKFNYDSLVHGDCADAAFLMLGRVTKLMRIEVK